MGQIDDSLNLGPDIIPVAAEDLADIGHHIQFFAAVVKRLFRFGKLDRRGMASMRETDGRTNPDRAALQNLGTAPQVVGHDTHAGYVIVYCNLTALFELPVGQYRAEQRVIDHLCNVFIRIVHSTLSKLILLKYIRFTFLSSGEILAQKTPALSQRRLASLQRPLIGAVFNLDADRTVVARIAKDGQEPRPVNVTEPRQFRTVILQRRSKNAAAVQPLLVHACIRG